MSKSFFLGRWKDKVHCDRSHDFLCLPSKETAGSNSWPALISLTSSPHPHPLASTNIHPANISGVSTVGQYCDGLHCLLLNPLWVQHLHNGEQVSSSCGWVPFPHPFIPAKIKVWALHPSTLGLVLYVKMPREGGSARSQSTYGVLLVSSLAEHYSEKNLDCKERLRLKSQNRDQTNFVTSIWPSMFHYKTSWVEQIFEFHLPLNILILSMPIPNSFYSLLT